MRTPDQPQPEAQTQPQPVSFADIAEQRVAPGGTRLAVRFVRRWTVYFNGDYAVFPARMAQRLVREGYADPVNPGQGEPPPGRPVVLATRYPVPVEARRRKRDDD